MNTVNPICCYTLFVKIEDEMYYPPISQYVFKLLKSYTSFEKRGRTYSSSHIEVKFLVGKESSNIIQLFHSFDTVVIQNQSDFEEAKLVIEKCISNLFNSIKDYWYFKNTDLWTDFFKIEKHSMDGYQLLQYNSDYYSFFESETALISFLGQEKDKKISELNKEINKIATWFDSVEKSNLDV